MGAGGGKRENGWHGQGTTAYSHHRCQIHHGLPTHKTTGTYDVAVFESCMMTMGVDSRELATLAVCGISTSGRRQSQGCHGHGDHRR